MLIGTPITGAILKAVGFKYVWIFGGSFSVFGSFFFLLSRCTQAGWKIVVKV
jgi:hypothetical protein